MSKSKRTAVNPTYATPTSPAMSETGADDKEKLHLSPAEFGAQLKVLGDEVKDLVKIARKVGSLKSGEHLVAPSGEKIGAKELNSMVSAHVKTLKQLKKNYTARAKRKKRSGLTKEGKERKKTNTFAKPVFLKQPLIDFFRNANFGNVPGTNEPVQGLIENLLEAGVLSRGMVTQLMTIYAFVNPEMRYTEGGKIYYRVTPEMEKYLGPYIDQLERTDDGVTKSGAKRDKFRRDKFIYNLLQPIVKLGMYDNESLAQLDDSEEKMDYLKNPDVVKAVEAAEAEVTAAKKAIDTELGRNVKE
jgi:hypothetical protein